MYRENENKRIIVQCLYIYLSDRPHEGHPRCIISLLILIEVEGMEVGAAEWRTTIMWCARPLRLQAYFLSPQSRVLLSHKRLLIYNPANTTFNLKITASEYYYGVYWYGLTLRSRKLRFHSLVSIFLHHYSHYLFQTLFRLQRPMLTHLRFTYTDGSYFYIIPYIGLLS